MASLVVISSSASVVDLAFVILLLFQGIPKLSMVKNQF
jgi:hypothetical protein